MARLTNSKFSRLEKLENMWIVLTLMIVDYDYTQNCQLATKRAKMFHFFKDCENVIWVHSWPLMWFENKALELGKFRETYQQIWNFVTAVVWKNNVFVQIWIENFNFIQLFKPNLCIWSNKVFSGIKIAIGHGHPQAFWGKV